MSPARSAAAADGASGIGLKTILSRCTESRLYQYGDLTRVTLSPALRWSNMKGPAQTGLAAKLAPSFSIAVGDSTYICVATSVESGAFRWKTTVFRPAALTLATLAKSLARDEPGYVMKRWTVA